jgi:hypothetical protein
MPIITSSFVFNMSYFATFAAYQTRNEQVLDVILLITPMVYKYKMTPETSVYDTRGHVIVYEFCMFVRIAQ